ncbi:MAG TPA: amidohydrolase family protein [Blastocatellia bacterium]|jgi:imidazolonepropionase-like amidohydrolase|nr:amidohydrolase family protein [Blastocatellia bacterium]
MKHGAPNGRKFCGNKTTGLRLAAGVRNNLIPAVLGFAILLSGSSRPAAGQTRAAPDGQLVLAGGTIYAGPDETPITNGVVVIRDGKIAAVGRRGAVRIPNGVATLDCSGLTITAGFWNSHVHFFERKWADAAKIPGPELAVQLQAMLTRYGFTSVFDLGSPWENTRRLRERIESGEVPGPRIRSTGESLIGKGWLPPDIVLRVLGVMLFPTPEVSNAAEALDASKKLLDSGTDGLKLHAAAQSPPFAALPGEAIRAAVDEAHRRNKPVFAHPTNPEGILAAVRGGVDIIAHTTPQSGPWDEAVLVAMRQAKVALIPTLKIWKYVLRHDRASLGELSARTSTGQLRAWLASGGMILFGTDVGGMDDYDPGDEYALMARAGMTFRQILASLTTAPAEKFGERDRLGRIAPGLVADLVVLSADPSRDVRAFAGVRYTIRDGRLIYQAPR